MELVNDVNDFTIGVKESDAQGQEVYRPLIMWNLKIRSYVSDPDISYRAYGCDVRIKGQHGVVKTFKVYIKEGEFTKFDKVRAAIVSMSHGELILQSRFDLSLWSDLVPRLLFDCADNILHQRPARNIGLQFHYLQSRAFDKGGILQPEDVDIVYKNVGKYIIYRHIS